MTNLKEKVIQCLKDHPDTANSDAQLTFAVIYTYMPEEMKKIDGKWYISTDALKLVREDHVKRIRALLNQNNLFLPTDPEVRKQRGIKEEEWRQFVQSNP